MKTCMMSTLLSLVMKLWKARASFYVIFIWTKIKKLHSFSELSTSGNFNFLSICFFYAFSK